MKFKRKSTTPEASQRSSKRVIQLPELPDYDPVHCLCCHSIVEGKKRKVTKVWMCAFEPSLLKAGETGTILATCGGNTVCFIDVHSGKVMKRFKDIDKEESFYTLAWSTLELEAEKKKINILAVAGESGMIKLIFPDQLVCYSNIRAHRKYISCLTFHPRAPNLLFSGSKDGLIMLWNIGGPGSQGTVNHSPLLRLKVSDSIGDPLSMMFNDSMGTLVAVTEKGCVGWSLGKVDSLSSSTRTRDMKDKHNLIFSHPKSDKGLDTVDSLVVLENGLVATKCVGSGEILVWDLEDHVRSAGGSQNKIQVEAKLRLKFADTDIKYIHMGYTNGVLGVGDDEGSMYLYDLSTKVKAKSASTSSDSHLAPSQVIEWPIVDNLGEEDCDKVIINTVALSSDHSIVACGTDNNLVCIWHKADDS